MSGCAVSSCLGETMSEWAKLEGDERVMSSLGVIDEQRGVLLYDSPRPHSDNENIRNSLLESRDEDWVPEDDDTSSEILGEDSDLMDFSDD
jgi:hypothetical protein